MPQCDLEATLASLVAPVTLLLTPKARVTCADDHVGAVSLNRLIAAPTARQKAAVDGVINQLQYRSASTASMAAFEQVEVHSLHDDKSPPLLYD